MSSTSDAKVNRISTLFYHHLDGLRDEFELLNDEYKDLKKQRDDLEATSMSLFVLLFISLITIPVSQVAERGTGAYPTIHLPSSE